MKRAWSKVGGILTKMTSQDLLLTLGWAGQRQSGSQSWGRVKKKERTQGSHQKLDQKTFDIMYSAKSLDVPCSWVWHVTWLWTIHKGKSAKFWDCFYFSNVVTAFSLNYEQSESQLRPQRWKPHAEDGGTERKIPGHCWTHVTHNATLVASSRFLFMWAILNQFSQVFCN